MADFPIGGLVGASATSLGTDTTAKFALGTRVDATNGQVWVYCKASGAIAACAAVTIDKSFSAAQITATTAATAQTIGIAQIVAADLEFLFIPISGANLFCLIDGTDDVNPGVALAPSPVAAGLLSKMTVSTQYEAADIRTITTASGTTQTIEVVLNHPHLRLSRAQ